MNSELISITLAAVMGGVSGYIVSYKNGYNVSQHMSMAISSLGACSMGAVIGLWGNKTIRYFF